MAVCVGVLEVKHRKLHCITYCEENKYVDFTETTSKVSLYQRFLDTAL